MERAIPTFPCRDLDSASAFYQSLGFHLGARYPTYAILQRGALGCTCRCSRRSNRRPIAALPTCAWRTPRRCIARPRPSAWAAGDSTHHGPGRPTLGHARIRPDRSRWQPAAGRPGASMRRQSSTGFAWPAPTTSPRWPRSGKPMSAKPGKPWMPATNRRSRHCSWPPRATACSGWRRPSSIPRFRPRPLVADRGRSGTGRRDRRALRIAAGRRQGLARELVGSAEEALRSRGAGLIRAQSALDAPLSNLFWQGLGWDADYLTFTRY